MRTAYFLDGIIDWFERQFERVKSAFVREKPMHRDQQLIRWWAAWLEYLAHQNDMIICRLNSDGIDAAEVARITAKLATSKQALDAAVLAAGASLPKTAGV